MTKGFWMKKAQLYFHYQQFAGSFIRLCDYQMWFLGHVGKSEEERLSCTYIYIRWDAEKDKSD